MSAACVTTWRSNSSTGRFGRDNGARWRGFGVAGMPARITPQVGESTGWRRLLAVPRKRVDVEVRRVELNNSVEPGRGARLDPGDGGAIHLDVLRHLVRHVAALLVVHLAVGSGGGQRIPRHDLQRVQQLALPGELAVPGALVGDGVDVELELAEEVVLVARRSLDDPEGPLHEHRRSPRCPASAPPLRAPVPDEWGGGTLGIPALALPPVVAALALQVERLRQPERLDLAVHLPVEVLRLAVEEGA